MSEAEESLLVMLQGGDLADIRSAVTAAGGLITHDLPIIDAVGARMTRAQLAAAREQAGTLYRVIDDLAWQPRPEPPADDHCALAGAIQLDWQDSSAQWRLYNKGDHPQQLTGLSIAWPASLGELRSIAIGEASLKPLRTEGAHAVDWRGAPYTLAARTMTAVTMEFATQPEQPLVTQSAIDLRVEAGSDCHAKLAPSYADPDRDSYYPSLTGAALLHANGITGRGVTVAILDSGLWEEPDALRLDTQKQDRILARYNAVTDKTEGNAFDESGHGTHIASVLVSSSPTSRAGTPQPSYRGIAPDAGLVVVKAFGRDGEAGFLDIVRAVQWILEHREEYDIRVLNLSFSARPRWPYWQDPVNQALMKAWRAGLFIVAAAGNEGPEPMSVGSPGNLPYLMTVGAVTDSWTEKDRNDDYIPNFSSRGPTPMGHIKPDLVAPGGHIAGLTRPGSSLAEEFPEYFLCNGEFVMTGSSQAASITSGLAALMIELDPTLSNNDLKCLLMTASDPAIDIDGRLSYSPFVQGSGMISIARALTVGREQCEQQALDIDAELAGRDHFVGPAIFSETAPPRLPEETTLIAPASAQEGPRSTRRWGASDHLQRLTDHETTSPIDWHSIFQRDQHRIRALLEPTK